MTIAGYADVLHVECGHIAFRVSRSIGPRDIIKASDFRLLDGAVPEPADIMACGSCGSAVRLPLDVELIRAGRSSWVRSL